MKKIIIKELDNNNLKKSTDTNSFILLHYDSFGNISFFNISLYLVLAILKNHKYNIIVLVFNFYTFLISSVVIYLF